MVPAGTVQAQDTAADVLKSLDDAYKSAVAAHDALAPTEDPAIHAKHRQTLLTMYAGLRSAWDALITWKAASNGPAPASVLSGAVDAIRDFVPLAVDLKVLAPDKAATILSYVNRFFPGGTP